MKLSKIISLSAIGLFSLSAFVIKENGHLTAKQITEKYSKINESHYFGKFEVSNYDYKNYLTSLVENNNLELYKVSLPDSTVWGNEFPTTMHYYFENEAFDNYPVIGISYENAVQYCNWLTSEYNSDTKRKFTKVLFHLPSKSEWLFAANGGDSTKTYTWNSPYVLDQKRGYMCNFLRLGDNAISYNSSINSYEVITTQDKSLDKINKTAIAGSVNSFYPNNFGLYNMCGNVAEMISEKGVAKGGSYMDPGYDVRIASEKNYTKQTKAIGFRVAMEIVMP